LTQSASVDRVASKRAMLKLSALPILVLLPAAAFAQQTRQPSLKPLPLDMDCEKVTQERVFVPAGADLLVKRGADYFLCRPRSQTMLRMARTAAVVVRSTQTISCGDGSTSDCIRQDKDTQYQIESLFDDTDLWRYFAKAPPSKADIIVQVTANDRANSSSLMTLSVVDSDSGTSLYHESRIITDIANDVSRLMSHFVAQIGRDPQFSKVDMDKAKSCATFADQFQTLQAEYEKKRDDFTFKNNHQADAQMDECELHWKDFVCLAKGGEFYAKEWNESGLEMSRKLALEYEELGEMEKRLAALRPYLCASH
jgi:hypothetical protein